MTRLVPHPVVSAALTLLWLVLNGVAAGQVLLGGSIALLAGWALSRLQPAVPRVRRWDLAAKLFAVTAWDILLSNLAVARLILSGGAGRRPGFVEVRLKLRSRPALAWLAVIVTATPGTAWVSWDPDAGLLLMHIFDLDDPGAVERMVQTRYEALLLEIFP